MSRAGINFDKYYIAEIDKFANKVSEFHYPDNIQLGDVNNWREWDIDWSNVGLVTAGFPCQSWSLAGKQKGDKDERGKLFWVTLDIMSHVLDKNPRAKFMLENVKMKKEFEEYITLHTENALGKVFKTLINSALVSAQNRNRYYWTNFPVSQPSDKGLLLKDIMIKGLEFISLNTKLYSERSKRQINKNSKTLEEKAVSCCCNSNMTGSGVNVIKIHCAAMRGRPDKNGIYTQKLERRKDEKSNTITSVNKDNLLIMGGESDDATKNNKSLINETIMKNGKSYALTANYQFGVNARRSATKKIKSLAITNESVTSGLTYNGVKYRKLTPTECARLQTFPDGWCENVISNSQSYKAYGNAWTVDVLKHIFECMERSNNARRDINVRFDNDVIRQSSAAI
ncbi:DNA (cytosine-5-)-methyltransferase [Providencia sneebia]|uniref:DNA (cytosine-5-)-methyltransferase n=1 Tax=Providencia sneebia DSM 19967 TaxID=1141660 RepID=K8W7B7_9GAMM|nr:DNA-cytosine methyltransferase [Providencia sneebia DSM 19967]